MSLTDRVEDLVGECDRRAALDDEEDNDVHYTREEHIFDSFQQLLRWVPCIRNLIYSQGDGHQLITAYQKVCHSSHKVYTDADLIQLDRGADSARGDDAVSLKPAIALWLNESHPTGIGSIYVCFVPNIN